KQKGKEPEISDNLAIATSSRSSKRPKNKNNSNEILQINNIEARQQWLEQEKQAIELLRQKVALEKELSELRNRENIDE
ncbi:17180_t:CDS:1, partial [Funneliformis geosporum]